MSLVATLIVNPRGPRLTGEFADMAADALARRIGAIPPPDWLAEGIACDIALPEAAGQEQAQRILAKLLAGSHTDFAIQSAGNRRKRALIADMDSTMIGEECIDELAAEIGVKDKVAAITARAMRGEIAFEPALRERVALLAGLPADIAESVIANRISLAPGGRALVATMKKNGAYTALVSGGFTAFSGPIGTTLGFDEHRANVLETRDGLLTGRVREPILGADAKLAALGEIAARLGLTPADFIAVGDGANDLPMLEYAGTGVALHAKPLVAERARLRIDHGDLTGLLYLQGYRETEIVTP